MNNDALSIPLKELVAKLGTVVLTIIVGLLCGYYASFAAFYVAAMIQAVNNGYDAVVSMNRGGFHTFMHLLTFLGSLAVFIMAVSYFAIGVLGKYLGTERAALVAACLLGIPALHMLVEVFYRGFTGKY